MQSAQLPSGMEPEPDVPSRWKGWLKGVALTAILAVLAGQAAMLPVLSVMGIMIISIMFGAVWRAAMPVPQEAGVGIAFTSKYLLRAGIILMGLRLNIMQIIDAGVAVLLIDIVVISFTIVFMLWLGRALSVDKHLGTLIAVGTAVCGAAAIVAVAPLIGARKETAAIAVACIAVLGTLGSLAYIFLFPYMNLDPHLYGILVGSTLHELAHVIAAGAPGGSAGSDAAIVVKLGRVALLIPVALALGYLFRSRQEDDGGGRRRKLPVPWFIFGFLAMSVVNSLGVLPEAVIQTLTAAGSFLLAAAMAGLGLSIKLQDFMKVGRNSVVVSVAGFVALAVVGLILVTVLY